MKFVGAEDYKNCLTCINSPFTECAKDVIDNNSSTNSNNNNPNNNQESTDKKDESGGESNPSYEFVYHSYYVKLGDSIKLEIQDNLVDKVTLQCDNLEKVSISDDGMLSTKKTGFVTCEVVNKDNPNKKDIFNITIEAVSIKLQGDIKIKVDEEEKITASGVNINTIEWVSSDPSVATVNANGIVKGIKVGTAKITAKDKKYPSANDTITVEVIEK